jgi:hypothetical protein
VEKANTNYKAVVVVVVVESVDLAGNHGKEENKECCNKKGEGGEGG